MFTIFLIIRQSSRCQKNDYNYKRHEFEANNVYCAYVQWRTSVHKKTFKCNFISSDRNYNNQAQYENQFAIQMSNTYSVRLWIKEKKWKTNNRASLSHRTKKIHKIICAIYGQDDRKSNSYIVKKSRNCFNENDVWQIEAWKKRKLIVQQKKLWKKSEEIYLIVNETISSDILWWNHKMFKMIVLRIKCHSS